MEGRLPLPRQASHLLYLGFTDIVVYMSLTHQPLPTYSENNLKPSGEGGPGTEINTQHIFEKLSSMNWCLGVEVYKVRVGFMAVKPSPVGPVSHVSVGSSPS